MPVLVSVRIALLCHAATPALRKAAFPADEPVDASGLQDLSVLGQDWRLARRRLTSPALCARQTAEALTLDATIDPALRDIDYGRWRGLTLAEAQQREPDSVRLWLDAPDAAPHGGESLRILLARVAHWMEALPNEPGLTLAVTHSAVIRAAVVHALDAGPESFWRIDAAPLSLARLSRNSGRWRLASLAAARMQRDEAAP